MSRRAARPFVLTVSLALIFAGSPTTATAAKIDLSPAAWPPGELAHYTHLQNNNSLSHPPARSKKGLVVGTTGALAVRSGVEALRQGGTAIDAALTTALAQTTLNAGATVSFAGKMALVYYEASTGEIHYLNASWDVPRAQASGNDIPECEVPDGRQVLVPGFMSGLETAHERFGKLPFKSLFGPALYFANQGFEIFPMLGYWIDARAETLTRLEGGREVFLKPDGDIYETGDWFRQPRLAKTLKKVARKGSRYMYRGRWAKELAAVVQSEGGRLTLRDLKAYRPVWGPPRAIEFDGHVVYAPELPGTGGLRLDEALTGLSGDELRSEGHYTESDEAFSLMLDAVARTHGLGRPGGSHSDGVLAIDSEGNIAALLHTINTIIWGATGIFVDGVSVADVGCWASPLVTDAGPGGRLPTGELVTIATRDGRPMLATSGVGSGLFENGLFSIVNVLTYGMNPQQAATTPTTHISSKWYTQVIHRVWEDEFERRLLLDMQARGYVIDELPPGGQGSGWSVVATVDLETGKRKGATAQAWNGMAAPQ